jgi:5'-nucleotidase
MKHFNSIKLISACWLLFQTGFISAQEITILHTNDMHSKLTGYGPESEYSPLTLNNDQTLGGFARLATIIKETKDADPDGVLVADAGDFLMGSLFHVAEEETGFQLHLMKEIGYDVITLGNHEFDYGPETFIKILHAAKEAGGYPEIVASNLKIPVDFGLASKLLKLDGKDDLQGYTVFERNGLKIVVFGLLGLDAFSVAPAITPLKVDEPLDFAQEFVNGIKSKEKPDLIICLSHSGIYPSEDGNSYIGEDIELAKKVSGIDIIISGHTHVLTPQAIHVNDTWIVQTGEYAQNVGKIKLTVENGEITKFDFNLISVDDKIKGDPIVHEKIENQKVYINENILSKIAMTYNTNIAQTDFDLTVDFKNLKNSNLGPFVADADKFYLESYGIEADFSMVASGTIRENIVKGKHGFLTAPDAFRVMSLGKGYDAIPGYPLAKIYITANELKKLCEILVMSRAGGGDGYLYTSGLKVYINPDKMMLRKVQKVELNGKEIDLSKKNEQMISIAADTYLLSFIGRIKKMSHGLVSVIPKDKDGNPVIDMKNQLVDIDPDTEGIQEAKEWIALIEYLKSFPFGDDALPLIPERYKKGDESLVELPKK